MSLDFARGLSVVAMVFYHLCWDIRTFWPTPRLQYPLSVWLWGGGIIGGAFLFIAGVSAGLTFESGSRKSIFQYGLKIFGLGLGIFAVSLFAMPQSPIYFGILHCIGASLVIASLIVGRPLPTSIAAIVSFGIGWATEYVHGYTPWMAWAGITYPGFDSGDYFPLFPWGGVLFCGLLAAPALSQNRDRLPQTAPAWALFLGRHSLVIYLLHQPILVGLVTLVGRMAK